MWVPGWGWREVMSHAGAGLGMEGGHESCGCRAGDGGRSRVMRVPGWGRREVMSDADAETACLHLEGRTL